MKYIHSAMLTALLLLGASGCFRPDTRLLEVSVPTLNGPECGARIQEALMKVEGVESAEPDYTAKVVRVRYNSTLLGRKNIEFVIAGAGFQANLIPADTEKQANLPTPCK